MVGYGGIGRRSVEPNLGQSWPPNLADAVGEMKCDGLFSCFCLGDESGSA